MNTGTHSDTEPTLSALYDRYFAVLPATTPELLDAAHELRYQIYCVEQRFEDPAQQVGGREVDAYDSHSVHAVLIYLPTGGVVGCVRLILPQADTGISILPIRKLLNNENQARLDRCDPARTAEISRYAVSRMFRRRQGENFYADVQIGDLPIAEARRLMPHVSLGLMRGVGSLAADHGVTTVCAGMAPALLRLLARFGLTFEPLGPLIDYHGLRQPCVADCEALIAGMAAHHEEYYQLLHRAYRSKSR